MTISDADRAATLLAAAKLGTQRGELGLGTAALLNLASPFLKIKVLAGGAAGNFTATGIKTTDALIAVLRLVGAATTMTNITDLTGESSITATNTINNTSGTATSSDKLLVVWVAKS